MAMEALALDKPPDQLQSLLDELTRLCEHVLFRSAIRLDQQARYLDQHALTKSCVNLAHYLALRELDLRPLQEKLAEAGLSSLGRAESHVFATLQSVVTMLSRALGQQHNLACRLPHPGFREGFEILTRNTAKLLGPSNNQHETRIMVTLATEAASDPQLVNHLIREGMDCARINCAHDSPAIWARMIEHVRQAAETHGRECRILMDLAGHKVRTGPIAMQPTTIHIKVRKNSYGLALQPARILLVPETNFLENQQHDSETPTIPLPDSIFSKLLIGDRLRFTDARGKKRNLRIYASDSPGQHHASCSKSVYLQSGTKIFLCRKQGLRYHVLDAFVFRHAMEQPVKISLKPGDDLILHTAAIPGEPARFDRQGRLLAPAHIACTLPAAIQTLSLGDPVWIDDGKISCSVMHTSPDAVTLRVLHTGPKGARLKPDKGLNFPETDLHLPALSEKDKQDLDFVCQHADLVGFSFVEDGKDIQLLISEIRQRNRAHLPIVAKIETPRAVRNLPEILFSSLSQHPLAIMIARGDLAVELGSVRKKCSGYVRPRMCP